MTRKTVLVTACGCPGGPSVIRALQPGFRVVGSDMSAEASGRFYTDGFHRTPSGSDPDFVDVVLDICEKERVDAVLPESSSEVLPLAKRKADFDQSGVVLMASAPDAIEVALDKWQTHQALDGIVPLPECALVSDGKQLSDAVLALGWPAKDVVLKKPVAKGGRGFWILSTKERCRRMSLNMRKWPNSQLITPEDLQNAAWGWEQGFYPVMAMERLGLEPGEVDAVDSYGSLFAYSKIRSDCRLGVHFRHEAKHDAELLDKATRIIDHLGLEHFVNVQFMEGKLLEVNPRISTQITCETYNMPLYGVKLALGLWTFCDICYDMDLPDGARAQYYHNLRTY